MVLEIHERDMWRKVVAIKYGTSNFGWYSSSPNGSYGVVFGDTYLNVGRDSFLIFPLRLVMDLLFLFGTIRGVGKDS